MKRVRNPEQRQDDVVFISTLYAQGYSLRHITNALNAARPYQLSDSQVAIDIRKVEEQWRLKLEADVNRHRATMLAKLDTLEGEYWAAWERSKRERTESRVKQWLPKGNPTAEEMAHAQVTERSSVREMRDGNPAFLAGVERVLDQRARLLGLYAPNQLDVELKIRQIAESEGLDPDEAVAEAQRITQEYKGQKRL